MSEASSSPAQNPKAHSNPKDSTDMNPAAHEASAVPADIEAMSYEQARDELVSVVGRLETGGASLEESLALWERGEQLATRCESWLEGARRRLDAARDQARAE
jgi:exodeoxyribonuclease VII small subunit